MSKLIYNKTKSHGNNNNILSGAGIDTIKIKIPVGQKYSRLTITMSSSHIGIATFNVLSTPKVNATGNQEIKVMWTYSPFSKCSYKLKVFTDDNSSVSKKPIVIFGERDWYQLSIGYINQKKPFTLRVEGPDAQKLFNVINPINDSLISRNITINEVMIGMTVAICISIVAITGLSVFGAVLLYSIQQGCTPKAKLENNGSVTGGAFGQIMEFDIFGCGGN
ncbi:hypothetical protein [Aquimarina spinulae]|uniref:hypothetical protein n=1 Tax=Aquimarina spinulae TaxID=1192023 RepID=UPI000D551B66|nr:hypothetical protein [Aquimarina spinulae]